ncbi:hypothetical protein ACFWAN_17400 [Streptomyces mirabilis]
MIFAVILLPPGLMGLLLVLGRHEELLFTPQASARHARRRAGPRAIRAA